MHIYIYIAPTEVSGSLPEAHVSWTTTEHAEVAHGNGSGAVC